MTGQQSLDKVPFVAFCPLRSGLRPSLRHTKRIGPQPSKSTGTETGKGQGGPSPDLVAGTFFPVVYPVAPSSNSATTSGTPTVAGFATASNPAPTTMPGISGFTTIRRALRRASNTSPAAG